MRRLLRSNRTDTDTPVIISTMETDRVSSGRLLEREGGRILALVDVALERERAVKVRRSNRLIRWCVCYRVARIQALHASHTNSYSYADLRKGQESVQNDPPDMLVLSCVPQPPCTIRVSHTLRSVRIVANVCSEYPIGKCRGGCKQLGEHE